MFLVGLALNVIIAQALDHKTYAGERVSCSPVNPLDLIDDTGRPVIAVYLGESDRTDGARPGHDLGAPTHTNIVIHAILPPSLQFEGSRAGLNDLTNRSGGASILLGFMGRQIVAALQADRSDWSRLLQKFCAGFQAVSSRPIIIELPNHAARFPAREIVLSCRTIGEPPIGASLSGPWAEFHAKLSDDEELREVADEFKRAIEAPGDLGPYEKLLAVFGLSWDAGYAMGLTPHPPPVPHGVKVEPLKNVTWIDENAPEGGSGEETGA